MAIKPVIGYTGSGWSYPTAAAPKKQAVLFKNPISPLQTNPAAASAALGGGLLDALGGRQTAPATLGTGKVGSGIQPSTSTTVTTTTPQQVYEGEILSDPSSVAAQGTFDTTAAQLAASRRDAFQRAVVNAGWDPGTLPTSLAGFSGDIDDTTRAAAAANQLSTRAQLQKQLSESTYNTPYQLGSASRSGQLAINNGQLQQQYQTASNQGLSDLMTTLLNAGNDYTSNLGSAQNTLESARAAVEARLAARAGYSQSITTTNGGGGDPNDSNPNNLILDPGSQSPLAPPFNPTKTAVAKVIKSIGVKKTQKTPPNIYQVAKNMMAG